MPKYQVNYIERYAVIVEAENEQRAKEIADCSSSFIVGCEYGDVTEIKENPIFPDPDFSNETLDENALKLALFVSELAERGIASSEGTNFDLRISREAAESLLINPVPNRHYAIMCKEYGNDSDWIGLQLDDLDDFLKLDDEYQTFEIWLSYWKF